MSYHTALHRPRQGLARIAWMTWALVLITTALWCFTAYQAARLAGADSIRASIENIGTNALDVHNDAVLTQVLTLYGAKSDVLIQQGQYWRFISAIFLHANALHIALNMLNLLVLGLFLERLIGPWRLLLIYLVTGVVSMIASFYFAPQALSVGASGAIFGLVGAYSIFVLTHRRAFPNGGLLALLWLVLVISINIGLGFFLPNVDNYAHLGGLLSGFILGWAFMPLYQSSRQQSIELIDLHSLSHRWPLALLTILGTLLLAIIALYLSRIRS